MPSFVALAGVVFAALANLGYSSRSCMAKKLMTSRSSSSSSRHHRDEGMDPFETFGRLTLTGALVGLLPLLVWGVFGLLGRVELMQPLRLLQDPRFNLLSWAEMSLSYLLYQACSVLILSGLAVESHALLVAMKH